MNQTILNLPPENEKLSMIIQIQTIMQEMKLCIIQKFSNLILVITTMPAFQQEVILFSQQVLKHKHLLNKLQKSDGRTIDDVEDLDLVMPVYNLIEYSLNYFEKQEVIQKMK